MIDNDAKALADANAAVQTAETAFSVEFDKYKLSSRRQHMNKEGLQTLTELQSDVRAARQERAALRKRPRVTEQ